MKLYIKNMVSNRCKIIVKDILNEFDLDYVVVDFGEVEIMQNISENQREELRKLLSESGLELMDDKKSVLIEKIKNTIIEIINSSNEGNKINFSHSLSEKVNHNYNYIANLFSEIQGVTIEQFIISLKVARIKELIIYGDLNISEIAWKMNYSSVAHLSSQFKKVTGLSPSHFRQLKEIKPISNTENQEQITVYNNESIINKNDIKFQSFLESVPDAIVIVNNHGNIETINNQTEIMFGYDHQEIFGKKIELLIPSRYKEAHQRHRDGFFDKPKLRKMGEGMELFAQRKNGNEFPVEISLSKIVTEDGFLFCASIRDISEQKRIEKELTEAKIIAENAAIAKQEFLSNMSHEIRTPMNAIIGFTKVILKTELNSKQKEYLTAIKMSGDTLIVLINDILDLAKVDAGKMVFEKTPFKLSISIATMLHLFEIKIQEKNLKLTVKYDQNIPEILLGDPTRLHQIILNLVGNAIKFTNEGKITVNIRKLAEYDDKITIEFLVSDTGIGIDESKIEGIFENFQQAHNQASRIYGGTGLGLAIVKKLVEAQGGSIRVESEIDRGSTFSFVLNFKKAEGETYLENELTELVDEKIKNVKVLVVEDVEFNQLLMRTLLNDFGFECDIVE
ncbi:ATP-binding protein, partial [Flavobacterium sp.]|uniref:ATP-binding protein n=1 Tax=Flavobacterium sp. TaxID=239 RepID=UPI0037535CFC